VHHSCAELPYETPRSADEWRRRPRDECGDPGGDKGGALARGVRVTGISQAGELAQRLKIVSSRSRKSKSRSCLYSAVCTRSSALAWGESCRGFDGMPRSLILIVRLEPAAGKRIMAECRSPLQPA
jgi:hypothetical protein